MRRLTLRLLGVPVVSVDIEDLEYVDEDAPAFGGGSAHDFTLADPFVDERYLPWDEEDSVRVFGFGAP